MKLHKVINKGTDTQEIKEYNIEECLDKLSGIAAGAEVNQKAFSNVLVGGITIAADKKKDTLELAAGSNIILTPDEANDKITIAATTLEAGNNITLTPDATHNKLTITATDTVYTHPSYTARTGVPTADATPAFGGTFQVSQPVSNATGHITAIYSRTITIPSSTATTSVAGLMSASDKTKLNATTDYIVTSGTSGIWYYEKYTSGILKCWCLHSKTGVNAAKNNYSGYYYSDPIKISLPFTMTSVIYGSCSGGSADRINLSKPVMTTTTEFSYWVVGHDSGATSISTNVNIHVIGRWK